MAITLLSHMKISYFTRTRLNSLSGHQDASRYCGPSQPCSVIHLVNIYSPFLSPKQLSEVVITRVLPSWGFYFNRSRRSPNLNTYKQSSVEPWSLPGGGHSSRIRGANASTAAGNNLQTWKSHISECRAAYIGSEKKSPSPHVRISKARTNTIIQACQIRLQRQLCICMDIYRHAFRNRKPGTQELHSCTGCAEGRERPPQKSLHLDWGREKKNHNSLVINVFIFCM